MMVLITKLEKLTPEQENLISVVRDEWLNSIFAPEGPAPLDKEKCEDGIEWLYKITGLEKPIIFFLDSPLGCQLAANILLHADFKDKDNFFAFDQIEKQIIEAVKTEIHDQNEELFKSKVHSRLYNYIEEEIIDQVNLHIPAYDYNNQVYNQVYNWDVIRNQDHAWDQVRDKIHGQVWLQIINQAQRMVRVQIKDPLGLWIMREIGGRVASKIRPENQPVEIYLENEINKGLYDELEYFHLAWRNFIFDADFGALYDYWTRIGIINDENVNKYIEYLKSYPGYVIFLQDFAFVCGLPREIHRDVEGRLHCETGPALQWKDGYSQYYWHGISVPRRWIDEPLSITGKDFLSEDNAEKRRVLHEILGTDRLVEILDLEIVDVKKVPFQTWDQEAFLKACQSGELGEEMVNFTEDKILTEPEKVLPFYDLFIKDEIQIVTLRRTKDKVDGDEKASFIEVRCPSTGEIFHLGVPSDFTDASEARAWTLYEDEKVGDFET